MIIGDTDLWPYRKPPQMQQVLGAALYIITGYSSTCVGGFIDLALDEAMDEDIMNFARGATHLSIFDVCQFFYQFEAHPDNWWKLGVNSHRGQEFFTIAPVVIATAHRTLNVKRVTSPARDRTSGCRRLRTSWNDR